MSRDLRRRQPEGLLGTPVVCRCQRRDPGSLRRRLGSSARLPRSVVARPGLDDLRKQSPRFPRAGVRERAAVGLERSADLPHAALLAGSRRPDAVCHLRAQPVRGGGIARRAQRHVCCRRRPALARTHACQPRADQRPAAHRRLLRRRHPRLAGTAAASCRVDRRSGRCRGSARPRRCRRLRRARDCATIRARSEERGSPTDRISARPAGSPVPPLADRAARRPSILRTA